MQTSKKSTAEIYNLDTSKYSRFPEENNCFMRALHDMDFPFFQQDLLTNMKMLVDSGELGFSRLDLALYAASWTVDAHMPFAKKWFPKHSSKDYIPAEVAQRPPDEISKEDLTKYVKRAGKFLGASEVGIARIDQNQNWIINNSAKMTGSGEIKKEEIILPEGVTHAIILNIEMDPSGIRCSPGFLEVASVGLGYSIMTSLSVSIAQFIRNLGYIAIPSTNDTGLSIPLAIDAGLGAQGRNGILLTKKYGPRVRIAKVFTNMPLIDDSPDLLWISKISNYCRTCQRCAEACEAKAISFEDGPSNIAKCSSNNPGVTKWFVDTNACYGIWVKYSTDCGNCIFACPFSKTPTKLTSEEFWDI
ncbi:MAG: 4Fe-4S dicluster domain-containing protein [Promethearchaeota archaeon]